MLKRFGLLATLCSTILLSYGITKETTTQSLMWTRVYLQLELPRNFSLHAEADNRVLFGPLAEHQFLVRLQARYRINETFEVGNGLVFSLQFPNDPAQLPRLGVPEIRPQQDFILRHGKGRVKFSHRYQMDERIFHNASKTALQPGWHMNFRARYRPQCEIQIWSKEEQRVSGIVADELMINFGKEIVNNYFDQNRVYVGLQYFPIRQLGVEAGYMHLFQQRPSGNQYFQRHLLRISIYTKLNLSKHE